MAEKLHGNVQLSHDFIKFLFSVGQIESAHRSRTEILKEKCFMPAQLEGLFRPSRFQITKPTNRLNLHTVRELRF